MFVFVLPSPCFFCFACACVVVCELAFFFCELTLARFVVCLVYFCLFLLLFIDCFLFVCFRRCLFFVFIFLLLFDFVSFVVCVCVWL